MLLPQGRHIAPPMSEGTLREAQLPGRRNFTFDHVSKRLVHILVLGWLKNTTTFEKLEREETKIQRKDHLLVRKESGKEQIALAIMYLQTIWLPLGVLLAAVARVSQAKDCCVAPATVTQLEKDLDQCAAKVAGFVKVLSIDGTAYQVSPLHNGRVYTLSKKDETFNLQKMNDRCKEAGGYLVEIDDQEEQDFVTNFSTRAAGKIIYVGANDLQKEGTFVQYNSKKVMSNIKWKKGEPNNYGSGEDCVNIRTDGLNDVSCSRTSRYICEPQSYGITTATITVSLHLLQSRDIIPILDNHTISPPATMPLYHQKLRSHCITTSHDHKLSPIVTITRYHHKPRSHRIITSHDHTVSPPAAILWYHHSQSYAIYHSHDHMISSHLLQSHHITSFSHYHMVHHIPHSLEKK
ncbi:Cd209 antigen [Plakobranchus ocellatus]|uniref:Cd209 antigen n=1 Tax=Plakobranchus ocellatus TaxID=259542 RepID=A0AAV3Y3Y3_9GAST|nr:Cd209 antigen [Plakobranchus ocellatus]